jgi:hypothetical protein
MIADKGVADGAAWNDGLLVQQLKESCRWRSPVSPLRRPGSSWARSTRGSMPPRAPRENGTVARPASLPHVKGRRRRGGYTFESRVEIAISDISSLGGLSPTVVAWLVAAVLRLQIETPVRMAVLGGMPFDEMGERPR